ncbi:heat shock protein 83-like, partial [Aphis craccivora]
DGILWESSGEGEYNITNIIKKTQGTEITLFLKKEEDEFLETWKIKNIVNKYSDHITVPVEIQTYDKKNKTYFWEQINKAQALWTRNKSSISDNEYHEFYKYLTNDQHNPITWSHNHVEGTHEYTNSNSLPLNVSREILQNNSITQNLKKALVKRSLKMLDKLSKNDNEKYQSFWNQFGLVLKEGPAEDNENLSLIANLLRFTSIKNNSSEQKISLKQYVSNMIEKQEKIYYITADSYISAKNSPHLELFNKKDIDVLLLSDRIDEWMMNYLVEFEGKKFQSISKEDSSLNKLVEEKLINKEETSKEIIDFLSRVKKVLGNKVKSVRLTNRLTETPCIVLSDSNEMSTQMAKLFTAAGQPVPELKYIFEINPKHELIKKISKISEKEIFSEWIKLLLDQSLFAEKGNLDNPHKFISRMNKLFVQL